MVRNLMMIFGLSLAVAAFGCSDDDTTNPGGAGGAGGSGGSGGAPAGGIAPACDNAADLAEIASGQPVDALSLACGTAGVGDATLCDPDATGMNGCYQDGTGANDGTTLSTECSYCYAELTCCSTAKCSVLADPPSDPPGDCLGLPVPGSPCEACVERECQPAFDTCGDGDPTDPVDPTDPT
jgi:hypothetical protein